MKVENDLLSESPSIDLLYCTPELIATPGFMKILMKMNKNNSLKMMAVDEAHCISSWGHDFRSSYLKLGAFRRQFSNVPVMALTATATEKVLKDIRKYLELHNTKVYQVIHNLLYIM